MLVLGLTGGTGAGKTTVLELLRKKGAMILDCDCIYYELLSEDTPLRSAIGKTFDNVFFANGELNRQKLGNLVFQNPAELDKLNALVYEHLGAEVKCRLADAKKQGASLCAVDAVNLLESGLGELCDATIGVIAEEGLRVQRIMERDSISEDYALSRIRAQKQDDYYRRNCDHILINNGDRQTLHLQVEHLLNKFG